MKYYDNILKLNERRKPGRAVIVVYLTICSAESQPAFTAVRVHVIATCSSVQTWRRQALVNVNFAICAHKPTRTIAGMAADAIATDATIPAWI